MFSQFFIERPVLANVLAILMMVIGGVALFALPVAQLPDVVPPTVQVSTRYPGASARTVIVTVFGAGQYSMRIWLDPEKLKARGLVGQDVIQALQQQSQQVAAGQISAPPTPSHQAFQYTLNVAGRLNDVSEYEDVIVKTGNA